MALPVTVRKPLDNRCAWFSRLRFGVFAHFGLYALLERGEWVMNHERIHLDDYRPLMNRFNPSLFNADKWISEVQRAGAKYFVITAKHHDGFCLFDSALTDYKITNTPFGRDLIGEIVAACHKAGLRIMLYYSQPDWAHPCYPSGFFKDWHAPRLTDTPDWPGYLRYCFGQVQELCTRYGRIDGIWFDGVGKTQRQWRGRELYEMIKHHQPHAVVNDRASFGDYYTPERRLATAAASQGYMVESCDCVAKGAWGWAANAELRTTHSLLHALVRMAAAGGNYLLNIGPRPDGTLAEDWLRPFHDIGDWMKLHGPAVHDTEGCLRCEESADQLYTRRGKNVYLHLLRWPETNRLRLSRLAATPTRARLLASGTQLSISADGDRVVLSGLPGIAPDPLANVIELTFSASSVLRPALPYPQPAALKFNGKAPLEVRLTDAAGVFISLKGLPLPTHPFRDQVAEDISNLWQPHHKVTWKIDSDRAGWVDVAMEAACAYNSHGSTFTLATGDSSLLGTMPKTKQWTTFTTVPLGKLKLRKGRNKLTMAPKTLLHLGRFGVLRKLVLTPR